MKRARLNGTEENRVPFSKLVEHVFVSTLLSVVGFLLCIAAARNGLVGFATVVLLLGIYLAALGLIGLFGAWHYRDSFNPPFANRR